MFRDEIPFRYYFYAIMFKAGNQVNNILLFIFSASNVCQITGFFIRDVLFGEFEADT